MFSCDVGICILWVNPVYACTVSKFLCMHVAGTHLYIHMYNRGSNWCVHICMNTDGACVIRMYLGQNQDAIRRSIMLD